MERNHLLDWSNSYLFHEMEWERCKHGNNKCQASLNLSSLLHQELWWGHALPPAHTKPIWKGCFSVSPESRFSVASIRSDHPADRSVCIDRPALLAKSACCLPGSTALMLLSLSNSDTTYPERSCTKKEKENGHCLARLWQRSGSFYADSLPDIVVGASTTEVCYWHLVKRIFTQNLVCCSG